MRAEIWAVAPPEKNIGGAKLRLFYDVIRNSDKRVNYVFYQLILCAAAYLVTPFLRNYSVLHGILFIARKHLNYIRDLLSDKSK